MTTNQGGYDLELFVGTVDEDLICPICHGVFRKPMMLLCEHIFCKACIEKSLNEKSVCPVCKLLIDEDDKCWPPQRTVLNILSRLELRCSKECKDVFKLEEIQRHEDLCSKLVNCPISGCNKELVKLPKLTEHFGEHSETEKDSALKQLVTEREQLKDHEASADLKTELSELRQHGFFSWHRWFYEPPVENDSDLESEMLECVKYGNLERVKEIACSNMVDLNLGDNKLFIHWAIYARNENMAILLMQCGVDPDGVCSKGETVIHYAAAEDMPDTIELAMLLTKSKHLNYKNQQDETPLHLAARKGSTEAIKVLLKSGADPNLLNVQDKTARDIARECRCHEGVLLLNSAMDDS